MTTDANGAVIARYDYLPFGESWPTSPSNSDPDKRQFAGKERDVETNLDYFGARYYRAQSGRFTTVDPIVDVQSAIVDPQRWNRYTYAKANPYRWVDPDGRAIESVWDLISLGLSAKAVWQDPADKWNWLSLGADAVSILTPGIPAIGTAIRATGRGAGPRRSAADAHSRSARARPRLTEGAPHGQRTGVLQSRNADLGARARCRLALDRAGQAESERVRRIIQWPLPR